MEVLVILHVELESVDSKLVLLCILWYIYFCFLVKGIIIKRRVSLNFWVECTVAGVKLVKIWNDKRKLFWFKLIFHNQWCGIVRIDCKMEDVQKCESVWSIVGRLIKAVVCRFGTGSVSILEVIFIAIRVVCGISFVTIRAKIVLIWLLLVGGLHIWIKTFDCNFRRKMGEIKFLIRPKKVILQSVMHCKMKYDISVCVDWQDVLN